MIVAVNLLQVIHWDKTLNIPKERLSKEASNLIEKLCCGSANRLGNNGADEIKMHPFFKPIEFDGLRKKTAPFRPEIKHSLDTSNFDPVDDDGSESDEERDQRNPEHSVNGRFPEHAFFEFTFKRFFDDAGVPYPTVIHAKESVDLDKSSETNSEANSPVYV